MQHSSVDCFLSQSIFFDQPSHQKAKQKQKTKHKKKLVELTEKYLKMRNTETYKTGKKLFKKNYCSECSGILLKIGFVTYEMKVYP